MSLPELSRRLELLRRTRTPTGADSKDCSALFQSQGRSFERMERSVGAVSGAWRSICPSGLYERTSIVGLQRGVLTLGVEDASTRYEIDRLLRCGAQRELIRSCPSTLRRVKVVLRSARTPDPDR